MTKDLAIIATGKNNPDRSTYVNTEQFIDEVRKNFHAEFSKI